MQLITDIKQPKNSRQANYDLLSVFDLFEPVRDKEKIYGTSGNIQYCFENYNLSDNEYKTKYGKAKKCQKPFHSLISAPMLLSRLVSAGCVPLVEGQDGYKITWRIILEHKKTKAIYTFYDWKGGSSYGSCKLGFTNEQAKKDFLKLLQALINPKFPHPYDGCVVGEIA